MGGAIRTDRIKKWEPGQLVEFKHIVEMTERLGRMSRDSMVIGNVWNDLQSAKGALRQLRREVPGPGDVRLFWDGVPLEELSEERLSEISEER